MRTTAIISILAALLLCAVACSPRGDVEALRRAEAILEDRPDSALALLDAIDPAALRDPDFAALHTLLHLRVRDKLGYNIGVDTGARHVIARLAHDGNPRHELLVSYYDSRFNMELHNYAGSILAANRAYDQAAAMDSDHFWMAMAARNISDAYKATSSSTEELDYAKLEYYHFAADGRQPHLNYAILDLARAYGSHSDYTEAIKLFEQAIDSAKVYDDVYLADDATQMLAQSYLAIEAYEKSIKTYRELMLYRNLYVDEASYLGIALALNGDKVGAHAILDTLTDKSTSLVAWLEYELTKDDKDKSIALLAVKRMDSLTNEVYARHINQNLTGTMSSMYELEHRAREAEYEAAKTRTWLLIVVLLVVVAVIVAVGTYLYRRQKKRLENERLVVRQIEEQLQRAKLSNKALVNLKFEILDNFGQMMYQYDEASKSEEKIQAGVVELIKDWKKHESQKFAEFAAVLDESYDNIYKNFVNDFPDLSAADYKLFVFTLLGFSGSTIAWFLKVVRLNSIYDRRKRLKNKIKNSDSPRKDFYLEFL